MLTPAQNSFLDDVFGCPERSQQELQDSLYILELLLRERKHLCEFTGEG